MKKLFAIITSLIIGFVFMWLSPSDWDKNVLIEVEGKKIGYFDLSKNFDKIAGIYIQHEGNNIYIKNQQKHLCKWGQAFCKKIYKRKKDLQNHSC